MASANAQEQTLKKKSEDYAREAQGLVNEYLPTFLGCLLTQNIVVYRNRTPQTEAQTVQ